MGRNMWDIESILFGSLFVMSQNFHTKLILKIGQQITRKPITTSIFFPQKIRKTSLPLTSHVLLSKLILLFTRKNTLPKTKIKSHQIFQRNEKTIYKLFYGNGKSELVVQSQKHHSKVLRQS